MGCPLYFDDILRGYKKHTLYWDNAILAVNTFQINVEELEQFDSSNHFVFYGEVYSGWFSSWGTREWEIEMAEKQDNIFL